MSTLFDTCFCRTLLTPGCCPVRSSRRLVSGSGEIKITKDGNVLLHEMQIQHPTASLIAKASTAQNDETGDGTTSTVLLIGELLKQAEMYVSEGLHPRVLVDGFELAKKKALQVLESCKVMHEADSRTALTAVARTALTTKLSAKLAEQLTHICVDAVLCVANAGKQIDLHMVEIMGMQHRAEDETCLVRGLVLDHGARHPDMKRHSKDAFILTCNVSLEYEKTTVNSGFFYKSAEERDKLVAAERKFIDDRCHQIVELKNQVVGESDKSFVVLNQQGIDPNSLDILSRAGIVALRRVKRRNMERIVLACGGSALNSLDGLTPDVLGHAGQVYEQTIGEERYTFIEDVQSPKSVTVLIKATTKHAQTQLREAVHDGLRAIRNALEDGCLVPGAGAFEVAAYAELLRYKPQVAGKAQMGVQAFADALLVVPKTLAANAGFDPQDAIVRLVHEHATTGLPVGIDLNSGEPVAPQDMGVFDNYRVKRQLLMSCTSIASNLLLVDEIMRAGLTSLKGGQ